jgi:hypothetical protein
MACAAAHSTTYAAAGMLCRGVLLSGSAAGSVPETKGHQMRVKVNVGGPNQGSRALRYRQFVWCSLHCSGSVLTCACSWSL